MRITNHLAVPNVGSPVYVVLGRLEHEPGVYQPRYELIDDILSLPLTIRISVSPNDVACSIFYDLLPIVVVCRTAKEAFQVDLLNNEVFAQIQNPEDAREIVAALENSKSVHATFPNGQKLYAVRYGSETGVYGLEWEKVFPFTKGTGALQKGHSTLLEALIFMLQKKRPKKQAGKQSEEEGHPASTRTQAMSRVASKQPARDDYEEEEEEPYPARSRQQMSRAASAQPVREDSEEEEEEDPYPAPSRQRMSRTGSRAGSPSKRETSPAGFRSASPVKRETLSSLASPQRQRAFHNATTPVKHSQVQPRSPSPSKGVSSHGVEAISRTASLPPMYLYPNRFPTVSISSGLRPSAARPQSNVHFSDPVIPMHAPMSASARGPTSSSARYEREIDDTFVDDLADLNLDTTHGRRQGHSALTLGLVRQLVRPPSEMLSDPDTYLPVLDMGPDFDLWSSNRNLEPADVVRYLQAFLWSPHLSDFVRMLGRPGPAELRPVDAEYVWNLLTGWFVDDAQ
ncbi:hypothetical protein TRAPUB_8584 [Trametes pubescens]|uniref:Uncharacterized protein n=1 Tax=Trametes pubescens TaxID=154538 RepID=A0A1M2W4S2_TRAPU|nr:hypothetical protein TRAPUB_8584 [Trametes pubescens]